MNEHSIKSALRWLTYAAPGTNPGDFGACCAELHEAVIQPESTIRLDGRGRAHLVVSLSTGAALPFYQCPFCGRSVQDRRG